MPIALFGWIVVTVACFLTIRPSLAVSISMVGAYLLLPAVEWEIASGVPVWSKAASASIYTLACAAAFAPGEISRFRVHFLDVALLLGGICWGLSSIIAGYGIKQAVPDWWDFAVLFGIPYLLGRLYFNTPAALRDLAVVMVGATCLYGVLMAVEMRTFPMMNKWIYGWQMQKGREVYRLGGYRPVVFLPNGLATSIWVCMTMVLAWGLHMSGGVKKILKIPTLGVGVALTVLAVLTRSGGAIAVGFGCLIVLLAYRHLRIRWAPSVIAASVVIYIATALFANVIPIRHYAMVVAETVYSDRAFSLETRFLNEELLVAKASARPILGWGGWGEWRAVDVDLVRERTGQERGVVTDGFWVIVFGTRGALGLITAFGLMLVPGYLALRALRGLRPPPSVIYPVLGLTLWSSGMAMDQLLNGFVGTTQGLIGGALASVYIVASTAVRSRGKRSETSSKRAEAGRLQVAPKITASAAN